VREAEGQQKGSRRAALKRWGWVGLGGGRDRGSGELTTIYDGMVDDGMMG
jgi:hypothetical protein